MSRTTIARAARITGHVSWWVFVVTALFAGGITWWKAYSGLAMPLLEQSGWTLYTPLTGTGAGYIDIRLRPTYDHWWVDFGIYALVAFVVLVIAAIVDAVAARRLVPGLITVAVPFVALGLFALATPGAIGGVRLHIFYSMLLVLLAVAIREVWMRTRRDMT